MSLKDRLQEDMKAAMRAKDAPRLSTIRMLLAACKQKEVDERIELDDTIIVSLVDKLLKQRKDSIAAFAQAGRQDLVDKESAEVVVLEAYLPSRLDAQAITDQIASLAQELGAHGPADMGRMMAAAKMRLAGKADMALVSAAVKQVLSR
jgi:uncharacterized protein YqeY